MKALLTILLSGLIAVAPAAAQVENSAYATVDRIEEENYAVLEICLNDEYVKMLDIPQEDFVTPKREGERLELSTVNGKFYTTFTANDYIGREATLYQFRSNDNSVWWALTTEEIGHIPDNNTEYTLIYYNNGTTAENKPCDCLKEWDCECEVYDDIFIDIREVE